ncbi:MAG: hypothetical protein ACXV3A_01610 [Kineosporiaceae bacterium]
MPRPARCPPELADRALLGTQAVRGGMLTAGALRSPIWVRIMRDVYAHRDHATDPDVRLQALRLLADRSHVVCGRTAAWLHGVWQPAPGACAPLEISRPKRTNGEAVLGQERRRLTLRTGRGDERAERPFQAIDEDVMTLGGVTLTSPLRTCFDLMRERRLVEAVVVADAFLYQGAIDAVQLAVYCEDRYRWPGVRRARLAASLACAYARSPGETRLRMALVLAGFEPPLVNVPVVDARGHLLATPDLQVRGRRWAWLEYDGAYHEAPDQHAADLRRENRLVVASGGTPVLRYDRRHLMPSALHAVVAEVARATDRSGLVDLDLRDFWRPTASRAW